MKQIKSLAVCLAACMLLFAAVSCNSAGTTATTAAATAASATALAAETTTGRIATGAPDADYGGYQFRILYNSDKFQVEWASRDIVSEGATGDTINDAVFARNSTIEDKYDVKIVGVPSSADPGGDIAKTVKAGEDAYDLISVSLSMGAAPSAASGYLLNLKQVPHVDLTHPWYDQNANQELSVAGKLYMTVGDLLVMDKDAIFIFLFNKDLIQQYGLDDPYQLVANNQWTVDKMMDMARSVTQDLNGDGKMDVSDRYGLLTQSHTLYGNVVSCGKMTVMKDSNDIPYDNMNDPMIVQSFNKWIAIFNDKNDACDMDKYTSQYPGDSLWTTQLGMFANKQGLFQYTGMNRVTMLRSMNCNFGILPNPKYDASQAQYANNVDTYCTSTIAIPVTVTDQDRTGAILEALSGESYYTLRPAYYDVSLKTKLLRDTQSSAMLDLIFATRCYDLGTAYNTLGIGTFLGTLGYNGTTDYASQYAKNSGKIDAALTKIIAQFNSLT